MKRLIYFIICSAILILLGLGGYKLYTKYYEANNYRAFDSGPHLKRLFSKNYSRCSSIPYSPNPEFPFSEGGRPNLTQMAALNQDYPGKVFVINLRETTGYYDGQTSVHHYGVRAKESGFSYSNNGWMHTLRRWLFGFPDEAKKIKSDSYMSEEEALRNIGVQHVRFELTRRQFSTNWNFVDEAIEIFESFPPNAWVYIHCTAGRGRTTTFSLLYDIFRNHGKADLASMVQSHFCRGGEDVMSTKRFKNGSWRKVELEGRKALIETFYQYMNAPDGYSHKKWKTWLQDHNIPVVYSLKSQHSQE